MDLKSAIRTVVDFPVEGVRFRDITPLLKNPEVLRFTLDRFYQRYQSAELDAIVAVDSRGFIFGSILAHLLGLPLIPARKSGKLPHATITKSFESEYRKKESLQIHRDALEESSRILVVDDLAATGGTLKAVAEIIAELGGTVVECAVVIELIELGAAQELSPIPIYSLVTFREDELGIEHGF